VVVADRARPADRLALLPINGAAVAFPWRQPPVRWQQSWVAGGGSRGGCARAAQVVPIHYGGYDWSVYRASLTRWRAFVNWCARARSGDRETFELK